MLCVQSHVNQTCVVEIPSPRYIVPPRRVVGRRVWWWGMVEPVWGTPDR